MLEVKTKGIYAHCPYCGANYQINIPKGAIFMAFADDTQEDYEDFFTDQMVEGTRIQSLYIFKTKEDFLEGFKKISEDPDGMWYWAYEDNVVFCSGACSPDDEEIFEEYFGLEKESTDARKPKTLTEYVRETFEVSAEALSIVESIDNYSKSMPCGKRREFLHKIFRESRINLSRKEIEMFCSEEDYSLEYDSRYR